MDKLILLKPDFIDPESNATEQRYFCPPCALVLGMLNYYPVLKDKMEITFVDYQKPRELVIDLIGADNQSCPVLILGHSTDSMDGIIIQKYKSMSFINDERDIAIYLSKKYKVGLPH